MTQYGFYFNGKRCTGCKTCELACKDRYDLPAERAFRSVYEYVGGGWSQADGLWKGAVFAYYVSSACNHCDMPQCFAHCPQAAISKDIDTGIVLIDRNKCIGCGSCVHACPYRQPKLDDQNRAAKCDLCYDRVKTGGRPVCVEACPLRALEFGSIDDLRAAHGDTAAIAPLPDPSLTKPNVVMTPPLPAKPVGDKTGSVANVSELA